MNRNDDRYVNFSPEVVYRTDWHVHDYIIRKGVDNPDKREIIGIGKCGYILSNQNSSIDLVPFGEEELWDKVAIEPIDIAALIEKT